MSEQIAVTTEPAAAADPAPDTSTDAAAPNVDKEESVPAPEDGADAGAEGDANNPQWVQSLQDVASKTTQAFGTATKVLKTGIDENLAKAKAPGGVFAKDTYVTFGDRVKQAFEDIGQRIRSLSKGDASAGLPPAEGEGADAGKGDAAAPPVADAGAEGEGEAASKEEEAPAAADEETV